MPVTPHTLISYNVLAKSFAHHISHTTFDRAERYARLIKQLGTWQAHIYAIQEAELDFLATITARLPQYNIHFAQRPLGKPDGLAFLIHKDVSFLSSLSYPLLFLDGTLSSRCAQRLLISVGGRTIAIIQAHLSWDNQPYPRHTGWQQLKHLLSMIPHKGWDGIILCGDWNVTRKHFLFEEIKRAQFIDALPNTPTHYGEEEGIDHIVHQSTIQSTPLVLPTSFPKEFSSDHLPVGISFW